MVLVRADADDRRRSTRRSCWAASGRGSSPTTTLDRLAALGGALAGHRLSAAPTPGGARRRGGRAAGWLILVGRADRRVWALAARRGGLFCRPSAYSATIAHRYVNNIFRLALHAHVRCRPGGDRRGRGGRRSRSWLHRDPPARGGGPIERARGRDPGKAAVIVLAVGMLGYGLAAAHAHVPGVRWLRMYLSTAAVVTGGVAWLAAVAIGLRRDRLRAAPLLAATGVLIGVLRVEADDLRRPVLGDPAVHRRADPGARDPHGLPRRGRVRPPRALAAAGAGGARARPRVRAGTRCATCVPSSATRSSPAVRPPWTPPPGSSAAPATCWRDRERWCATGSGSG